MCINDNFKTACGIKAVKNHPKFGEICTVVDRWESGSYVLSEYFQYNGYPCAWNHKKFIPLSDIDETELIKEREVINA